MFGKNAYMDILCSFKNNGYVFKKFLGGDIRKTVHLRHDIDFSVEDAYELAMVEKEVGVFSTYFFMLTSNTYNLLSEANQALVRGIKSAGHEISLHFDPLAHADMNQGLIAERSLFKEMFEVNVDVISLHRPGAFLENNNRLLPGCRHAYEDEFFRSMKYISDSGGRDIKNQLFELSSSDAQMPLHVLLHPIWWTSKSLSPTATLLSWMRNQNAFMLEEIRRNCKTFEG